MANVLFNTDDDFIPNCPLWPASPSRDLAKVKFHFCCAHTLAVEGVPCSFPISRALTSIIKDPNLTSISHSSRQINLEIRSGS